MGDTNRKTGNDYFLSPNVVIDPNISGAKIVREEQKGFGELGDGILSPYSKKYLKAPISLDNGRRYLLNPMGSLSEEEKTKQLSQQIADSIQTKIDEAAIKNEAESKLAVEVIPTDKKGMPVGLIIVCVAAGLLAVGMVVAIGKQMKKVTPKKVIL